MQISFFQRAFSLNALSGLKPSPFLTTGLPKRQALDSFFLSSKPVHPAIIEQEKKRQRQEAPRPVLYAPSPLPSEVYQKPEKPKESGRGVTIIDFNINDDVGSGDVSDAFRI